MCVRYLGVFLLVWNPQVLHAQSAAQPCPAPSLNGGFFSPGQSAYNHEANISYACHDGFKPAVKGCSGSSRCQNGNWSPNPQCIDEKACVPLTIPNGNYDASTDGWYEDRDKIRVRCDEGYEHKDRDATAQCINGAWSSVPICESVGDITTTKPVSGVDTCGTRPLVTDGHVLKNNGKYLRYQCAAHYQLVGPEMVGCYSDGTWSEAPTCKATFCSVDTDELSHVKSVGVRYIYDGEEENLECSSSVFHFSEARCTRGKVELSECVGDITTTKPVSGVHTCGTPPLVTDGDVVENTGRSLRYQCAAHYERVGLKMVVCYSDGTWSEAPTCKATFCSVDTDELDHIKSVGVRLIYDGEKENLECSRHGTFFDNFSEARCTRGKVTLSECCNWFESEHCKDLLLVGM